jgi:hypothetical protein
MARQNSRRLIDAWRALSGGTSVDGWRTIPVELGGPCRLLAGKHFPGDYEAILVGFKSANIPAQNQLPQGHGFDVSKVESKALSSTGSWISVSRKPGGRIDLFTAMSENLISLLEESTTASPERLLGLFLARIRAWQAFMEQAQADVLGPEAETGLFGELVILEQLMNAGVLPGAAVESWHGPLDELHDFVLGHGVIEVKATTSEAGFPANIGSLEQLDEAVVQPLFLAAVRLSLSPSGKTLPEFAEDIRQFFEADPPALRLFESRLVNAGLLAEHTDHYVRGFSSAATRILLVDRDFPKLARSGVRPEIHTARYQIDLDLISQNGVPMGSALRLLGIQ